jgi:hypothetical protein
VHDISFSGSFPPCWVSLVFVPCLFYLHCPFVYEL